MKFISKSANYMMVLEPGLPASPIAGTPARPTVFVKFTDGMVDVKNEDWVKKMLASDLYGVDFFDGEAGPDPYAHTRSEIEPRHFITELKHGSAVATMQSQNKTPLSPELSKIINDKAMEMVKAMLPGAVEAVLKGYAEKQEATIPESKEPEPPAEEPTKKPMGRQTKKVLPEVTSDDSDSIMPVEAKSAVMDFLKN